LAEEIHDVLVETERLTKRFGDFTALLDCSLSVRSGEVFGLLGPNGAGKTTLIRLLLGFLRPTSGSAQVAGFDCFRQSVRVREQLAYLPAEAKLFRRMKANEALEFFASLRGSRGNAQRALRLAGRLDLDLTRRIAFMSTGMRQKLALATTLSHDTPLVILDEPTANLDPNVRSEVMKIVEELRDEGRTVLLSSHVLSEIEDTCDRVVILRAGQVVHLLEMNQLRQRHRIRARSGPKAASVPAELRDSVELRQSEDRLLIETEGDLARVLVWLAGLQLREVKIEPYGLRSVYDQFHAEEAKA
jgi:ABC-2 type transport system ATP-binding protein